MNDKPSYSRHVDINVWTPENEKKLNFDSGNTAEVQVLEIDDNSEISFYGINTMEPDNTLEQRKAMITEILEAYNYDVKILIVSSPLNLDD